MLTVVCAKTRIIWLFQTASKILYVRIVQFILTTLLNEQHPCKRVTVHEKSALEKSTDVTNLIIDEIKTSMETTGGDASWRNGKN